MYIAYIHGHVEDREDPRAGPHGNSVRLTRASDFTQNLEQRTLCQQTGVIITGGRGSGIIHNLFD